MYSAKPYILPPMTQRLGLDAKLAKIFAAGNIGYAGYTGAHSGKRAPMAAHKKYVSQDYHGIHGFHRHKQRPAVPRKSDFQAVLDEQHAQ